MGTTVLLDEDTRDALGRSRDALGAASMDEAIRRIMRDATPTAKELWRRHRRRAERVVRQHGVTRLIAFGSRVRDDRHPGSDLDLVAEFPAESGVSGFFALRDDLSAALGVNVDLGDLGAATPRVLHHLKEEGVALVGPRP